MPGSSINLLTGGYLSVLHRADMKRNKEIENIGSEYARFDLGVRLGSEIELLLFENLSVAPGLFFSLGVPNIYKGNFFNRTHNGSAEFRLTFYYH